MVTNLHKRCWYNYPVEYSGTKTVIHLHMLLIFFFPPQHKTLTNSCNLSIHKLGRWCIPNKSAVPSNYNTPQSMCWWFYMWSWCSLAFLSNTWLSEKAALCETVDAAGTCVSDLMCWNCLGFIQVYIVRSAPACLPGLLTLYAWLYQCDGRRATSV